MNSNKLAIIALVSSVKAAEGDLTYDYALHGSDWDLDYPACGDSNQSPINLITVDRTAADFEYRVYDKSEDALQKRYTNQALSTVAWTGDTTKVTVDNDLNGESVFQSNLGVSLFGASPDHAASHFLFHAGSEHTINGDRLDLEMQTIHSASNSGSVIVDGPTTTITTYDVLETGVSVLFSSNPDKVTADLTEAEIQIIDTFFQSLQWDNDLTAEPVVDPVADLVTFGNLMELVDFDNRWAYKGSGTTPPCTSFVYWNVLSTVYPIKAEHVELFKN